MDEASDIQSNNIFAVQGLPNFVVGEAKLTLCLL